MAGLNPCSLLKSVKSTDISAKFIFPSLLPSPAPGIGVAEGDGIGEGLIEGVGEGEKVGDGEPTVPIVIVTPFFGPNIFILSEFL